MANKQKRVQHDSVGAWAKRCYLAGRAAMESLLRPHDLGATQWYVLYYLSQQPTPQRELVKTLQVERATLSGIIAVLVRKGLVEQVPDAADQRQKLLRMTPAGLKLWDALPDLAVIHRIAFDGIDAAEIAAAVEVLKTATGRLEKLAEESNHDNTDHRDNGPRRGTPSAAPRRGGRSMPRARARGKARSRGRGGR